MGPDIQSTRYELLKGIDLSHGDGGNPRGDRFANA